jgi:hypothetical protein
MIEKRKSDHCSTEMAANIARISYITLRRWLASGDFQAWLKKEGKPPLEYTSLANGKRIWTFSIANRRDLIAYRDLPERRRRREPAIRTVADASSVENEQTRTRRMRHTLQQYGLAGRLTSREKVRAKLVQRYVTVLTELKSQGLCPQNEVLEYCPHEYVSEVKTREAILHDVKALDARELLKDKPESPMYFRREVLFNGWSGIIPRQAK